MFVRKQVLFIHSAQIQTTYQAQMHVYMDGYKAGRKNVPKIMLKAETRIKPSLLSQLGQTGSTCKQ